jgi:hypothetical protein
MGSGPGSTLALKTARPAGLAEFLRRYRAPKTPRNPGPFASRCSLLPPKGMNFRALPTRSRTIGWTAPLGRLRQTACQTAREMIDGASLEDKQIDTITYARRIGHGHDDDSPAGQAARHKGRPRSRCESALPPPSLTGTSRLDPGGSAHPLPALPNPQIGARPAHVNRPVDTSKTRSVIGRLMAALRISAARVCRASEDAGT